MREVELTVTFLYFALTVLWNMYQENENYGVIKGHKGAVTDLRWSRDSRQLFTSSSDSTIGSWDIDSGARIRKHVGHNDVVNSIDSVRRGIELVVSGSDDGSIALWDPRAKEAAWFKETTYPVIAVAVDSIGSQVFTSGIDDDISVWDLRNQTSIYKLHGHTDAVTSLSVSHDDQTLLSNAFDSTVRTWDIKPFAPEDRALKVYHGAPSGVEQRVLRAKWNSDDRQIAAGSSDRTTVIWDAFQANILYKLPGHLGSVNDVAFSPNEPIIVSGSSDRTLMLGELAGKI